MKNETLYLRISCKWAACTWRQEAQHGLTIICFICEKKTTRDLALKAKVLRCRHHYAPRGRGVCQLGGVSGGQLAHQWGG